MSQQPIDKETASQMPASNDHLLHQLVSELKAQCNRHTNGSCQTLACLQRGGYERGDKPNYDTSTCERHEQAVTLETLLANSEFGIEKDSIT